MRWSACGSLIVVLAAMAVVIHATRSLGVAVPAIVKVYSGFLPAAPRSIAPSSVDARMIPAFERFQSGFWRFVEPATRSKQRERRRCQTPRARRARRRLVVEKLSKG